MFTTNSTIVTDLGVLYTQNLLMPEITYEV